MSDPFAAYRWAWAQHVPPEEKLLLLALADGEQEPRLDAGMCTRTGLGAHALKACATRLHQRGLIDDNLQPIGPHELTETDSTGDADD